MRCKRFKRALFGLAKSPFFLAGTLKEHLETLRTEYRKHVEQIMRSLYVDDIITREDTVHQVHVLKGTAMEVLKGAAFELHKWNPNIPELEQIISQQKIARHMPRSSWG